ncbi:MAG TPA: DUF447 domain-containing protein [Methanoregula sp.]|nr:DUF447 domain-containing protein [Methanoregula sp.]
MVVGILNDGINEVIATTALNAAPMGIRFRKGTYALTLYPGSHTAENIRRDGWVVANLVFDPVLYVMTAFEDPGPELFAEEVVNGITMQRLVPAEAWIAFSAKITGTTKTATRVGLRVEKECEIQSRIRPVNRGFNSIIDATVHATRYVLTRDPELLRLIDYHSVIVRKCGGPRETEALGLLMNYIRE